MKPPTSKVKIRYARQHRKNFPEDKQLRHISFADVLQKCLHDQALSMKELSVRAGVSYSLARGWFRELTFPALPGRVVFYRDFVEWRNAWHASSERSANSPIQSGDVSFSQQAQPMASDMADRAAGIRSRLPSRAARILQESGSGIESPQTRAFNRARIAPNQTMAAQTWSQKKERNNMSTAHTKRRKNIRKLKKDHPTNWKEIIKERRKLFRQERAKAKRDDPGNWRQLLRERLGLIHQVIAGKTGGHADCVGAAAATSNAHQAARMLGESPKHVLIVVRAGHLHMSKCSHGISKVRIPNDEIQRVANDAEWRSKANATIQAHYDSQKAKRRAPVGGGGESLSSARFKTRLTCAWPSVFPGEEGGRSLALDTVL